MRGHFAATEQENTCLVFYTPRRKSQAGCSPLVDAEPSEPWGRVLCARLVTILSLPSPHWVAGLALTFLALQCAGQQELPGREFFLLELLREMRTSPGTLNHPKAWQEGIVPGQRNGVSRDCFQSEGISEEAFFFSVEAVGFFFFLISFSPPRHICTEWEIKAAVSNVLAHRKVLKHPPSSCTASTWEKYLGKF